MQKNAASISEFSAFTAKYNKDYTDALEADQHLDNFLVNKARIEAKNAKKTKAKFLVDRFADLSDEEFLKKKTGARLPDNDQPDSQGDGRRRLGSISGDYTFEEIDWTHKMTDVKD